MGAAGAMADTKHLLKAHVNTTLILAREVRDGGGGRRKGGIYTCM